MPRTRLTESHRDLLRALVDDRVEAPAEMHDMEVAYAAADELVLAEHARQFPASDMAVLDKYGVTDEGPHLPIIARCDETGETDHCHFICTDEVKMPLSTRRYYVNGLIEVPLDGIIHKAIVRYNNAKKDYEDRLNETKGDYCAMIDRALYFEDVVDLWEEANELKEKICG